MAPRKPENALVVRVFAYPTTAFGVGPDDEGTRPLQGATVTITQGPGALPAPRTTGPDGVVRFEDLEEGNYRIQMVPPPNFQPPSEIFRNGRSQRLNQNIQVRKGGEVVLDAGAAPQPGQVNGTVTVPNTVDPAGIRIEARSGGRLVDFTVTAAGANGVYQLADIDQPGLVEIRPDASYDDGAGHVYVPRPGDGSRFVHVPPGQSVTVDLGYVPTNAEIKVGAQLLEEVDGRSDRRPLQGITFQLFELGKSRPLREMTVQQAPGVFRDLPAGSYRVVAVPPPDGDGRRVRLTRPAGSEITLTVEEGQPVDLTGQFVFQPTRGSVRGTVVIGRDDTPVPGVAVVLASPQRPQLVRRVLTDEDGEFSVDDLPEGTYSVALEDPVVTAFGRRWEQEALPGTTDAARTVEVRAHGTSTADFRLVEEQHVITGQVFGPGGVGAPHVIVQVLADTDPGSSPIANVLTDERGFYEFRPEAAGTFFLRVLQSNGAAAQLTPVAVNSTTTAPPLFTTMQPSGGGASTEVSQPAPRRSEQSSLDSDFPFLTEEVDLSERGGTAQPAGGAGGVGRIVERQIRDVLGWRPRANDPKGFQAALQQAFTVREVAGHTEVEWRPRSYSVDIQADLGALTGAQASIYTRAKGTLDDVLPLLDGLTPLRTDFDEENVSAIRAIVRSQLTELVGELGVEGGPRVRRVDQLFDFLLVDPPAVDRRRHEYGSAPTSRDPACVGGSLGVLRDRLGLVRERINTIDEEQNFTNFLVLLDQVAGLKESFEGQRQFFDRRRDSSVEPFLGTQLVLLSRDLEVVAESVHEVEYAMDSVFLGPAERQTLELRFDSDPPMFVAELLDWVEQFATEEGRRLIDEGGRQGVVAFAPTVELLAGLVFRAQVCPPGQQDEKCVPAAYRRQRVQRALQELAQQLEAAFRRVKEIDAPVEDGDLRSTQTTPPQPSRSAVNR